MSLPPYRKIDQSTWSRQDHYKYYTGRIWGLAQDYHLCIDTSTLSTEQTLALIRSVLPC